MDLDHNAVVAFAKSWGLIYLIVLALGVDACDADDDPSLREKVLKSATSGTDRPSDANLPRQALARSRSPADVSIRGFLLGWASRGAEAASRGTIAPRPRRTEPISSTELALFSIRFRA